MSQPVVAATAPSVVAPAAIRIATTRARIVRGTLSVRIKCTGLAGQRCSGRMMLTAKAGKRTVTLGSAPYTLTAGRASTVRVPIRPRALRRPLPRSVTVRAGTPTKPASAVRTITLR